MSRLLFDTKVIKAVIADEHAFIRKTVERVLIHIGISDVMGIHSGKEFKQILADTSFNLYLMDIQFEDTSGFDIVEMIRGRELNSDCPIIIITAEASKEDFVKVMEMGANEYILKPIQPDELEKKLITVLNKYYSPSETQRVIRTAENYMEKGRLDEAKSLLEPLFRKKPTHPQFLFLMAKLQQEMGDKEAACKILERNIQVNPGYLKSYKTLSNIYLDSGQTQQALEALTKELEVNPKQILRQIKLANLHLKTKAFDLAIEHFRLALLENNRNAEGLYGMAVAYAKANNLEKSLYYFRRLRRTYPEDSRPLETVVRLCKALRKLEMAEVMLRDEKKAAPNRLDTYYILAQVYFDTERPELAIEVLEEATKRNPTVIDPYHRLADYYESENDFDSYINVYLEFLNHAKDEVAYIKMVKVYAKKADLSSAISLVHSALKFFPKSLKLFKLLYQFSLKTKQIRKGYFLQKKLLNTTAKDKAMIAKHKEVRELIRPGNKNMKVS